VAVASSSYEGVHIFLFSSSLRGGDVVQYVSWQDLIHVFEVIILVITLFYENKKS